jgi:hypothetical protein
MIFFYYLVACLIVGFFGRNRKSGFALTLILSLIVTPVITGLLLLVTKERK